MPDAGLPLELIDVPAVLCQHDDDPFRVRPNEVYYCGAVHYICDACSDAAEARRKQAVAEYLAQQRAIRAAMGECA